MYQNFFIFAKIYRSEEIKGWNRSFAFLKESIFFFNILSKK